jgi:hypothetical protein
VQRLERSVFVNGFYRFEHDVRNDTVCLAALSITR